MIDYEMDDGGREAAGRKGKTGDCVTRALAILTGRPYLECYRALAEANSKEPRSRSYGKVTASNGVAKRAYEKVYRAFGLEKVKLPAGAKPTFSEAYETYGDCVVTTAKHIACLKAGALHDIWDGREYDWEGMVYERKAQSVWVKEVTA